MDKQTFIKKALELQGRYIPNQTVLAHLKQLDLIAVVGPTGVGKTVIMEKSGLPYVQSDVTREARKHETDGVEYNFRTDYDQLWQELETGHFVQYLISETKEFYGTKAAAYPTEGLCTIAIFAHNIAHYKSLGFRHFVQVYIVPPDNETWMKRISAERLNDLQLRLHEARQSLEIALSDSDYIFLVNDDLNLALNDFHNITIGVMPDAALQTKGRDVALKLLTQIVV